MQKAASSFIAGQISMLLNTRVKIERIDLGLFNRIILDNVLIYDQNGKEMFHSYRLAAKIDIIPLLNGQISISNIQLYGFDINLYQETEKANPNFYFLKELFASKEKKNKKQFNLRFNSILIRRGDIKYNKLFAEETPGKLNKDRINIHNFNATVSLKALEEDSVNLNVKRLSFDEESGLSLKHLSFKLTANSQKAVLEGFNIKLPESHISMKNVDILYRTNKNEQNIIKRFSDLRVLPSNIDISLNRADLTALIDIPGNLSDILTVNTDFWAESDIIHLNNIRIENFNSDKAGNVSLNGNAQIKNILSKDRSIHLDINEMTADVNELSPYVPKIINNIKKVSISGEASYSDKTITADLEVYSDAGKLKLDAEWKDRKFLSAGISSKELNLEKIFSNNLKLGKTGFDLKAGGKIGKGHEPEIFIKGKINELTYNQYPYSDIFIDIKYINKGFGGLVSVNDHNANLTLESEFNLKSRIPYVKVNGEVVRFCPNLTGLTDKYKNTAFKGSINVDFRGDEIDNMSGTADISNFVMEESDSTYNISSFSITSRKHEDRKSGKREIRIESDFMNGSITGDFKFGTLINNSRKLLNKYLPSFVKLPENITAKNDSVELNLNINSTKPFEKIFGIPLYINNPCNVSGSFDSRTRHIALNLSLPDIKYGKTSLKNIKAEIQNNEDSINCSLYLNNTIGGVPVDFILKCKASDNELFSSIEWQNFQKNVYKGKFCANTVFSRNEEQKVQTDIYILPSEMVINDSVWNIHASEIKLHPNDININGFSIEQGERHLKINGNLRKNINDTITAELKDINLKYVFDIINFHAVDFDGRATGKVYATGLNSSPVIDAFLNVNDFTFNNAMLGYMNIHGGWIKKENRIFLNADIQDPMNNSRTKVDGDIIPGKTAKSGLDLYINTERIDIAFLNKYTSGIFENMQGRASGWTRVFGPFKAVNIEGDILVNEARTKVLATNTSYFLSNDSVILRPDNIYFKNARIYDYLGGPQTDGHYAIVNGKMQHKSFSNLTYDINIEAHNILGYNQEDFGDESFRGTAFASGNINIKGWPGEVNIDINAKPERNTVFTYNLSSPTTLSGEQFITYKHLNNGNEDTTHVHKETNTPANASATDMRINFQLDLTPEATMKILMDPKAGDYIAINGDGFIRASYYNKGKFNMYGTYSVVNGIYKLSLQDVIRKDFIFKQGGTITFSGEPYQADLNLQAVYTVPSVSLNDLSARSTFSQNNVRVNCIMNLTGKAQTPNISFDFDLPTVNEDEKQMVKSLISTEEEKNMQVIYLLGIGRFYTYDYNNTEQSQSSVAMKSLLSSTISGQLNQMLSSILGNNSNWNIGTNLSTGEKGWSDMDVEGLLSGRLLNNRLLINGNFGYRENSYNTNNFVSDFDIQWLLTPNRNISLKAYSKTNDRYFTKSTLTTQGVGISLKKDFSSWREIFKVFIPKRKRNED